jgi:limonene 1,2-monooxygenase
VARYVIPEINGYVTKLRASEKYLQENRAVFDRAGQAIMAKIMENKDAAEALKVTNNPRVTAAGAQVPKGLGKQAAE